MYYFDTHHKIIDLSLENQRIIILEEKNQKILQFKLGKRTQLKDNCICLKEMVLIEIPGIKKKVFTKQKINQIKFEKEKMLLFMQKSIWEYSYSFFKLK